MSLPELVAVSDPSSVTHNTWDAVVVVSPEPVSTDLANVDPIIAKVRTVDLRLDQEVTLVYAPELSGQRLVLSPTGPVGRDQDDVRRFGDAARAGVRRAIAAGARRPLLVVHGVPNEPLFAKARDVALLESLSTQWSPLEAREAGAVGEHLEVLGWFTEDVSAGEQSGLRVLALENGRSAARDVTGTEPERMAPLRIAEYCRQLFHSSPISVEVTEDRATLELEYPLLAAVGRASFSVARHQPCVIRLEYVPEGPVDRSILLAGKGVAYDTGGADIKYGGAMAGMSRDKGGAGAVIGLFATLSKLRPPGVHVVAEIGAVRNSVGADAYVTDEILTSHAGVRVRVGNTDAEGRLVLADLLSKLRLRALSLPKPRVLSVATLTGHVGRAVGPYTVAIDNGPARAFGVAELLASVGEQWGEPVEISRLRREDWEFVRPRSAADDVLSCNNAASTATPRGHQFPMAFLAIASGLSGHGKDGHPPLPFTHLDIGGSAVEGGDWQHGRPTGAPVVSLALALAPGECGLAIE